MHEVHGYKYEKEQCSCMGSNDNPYGREFWTWEAAIITVGALASKAYISVATKVDAARLQGCVVKQVVYQLSWVGKTATDGPLQLFFHIGDTLTAVEVAEAVDADPQVDDEQAMVPALRNIKWANALIPAAAAGTSGAVIATQNNELLFKSMKFPSYKIRAGMSMRVGLFNHELFTVADGIIATVVLGIKQQWLGD